MKTLKLSLFMIFIISCNEGKSRIPPNNDPIIKGDHIIIPENSPVLHKITVETVTEQEYSKTISSVGTIQAIPNNYAEIASPFSGRIIRSFVHIGQRVSAGSPVFEILSSDYFSVQKDYSDALNDVKLAEKNYKRQADLVKHGVGVQKELEEAEAEYQNKKNSVSSISSALKVYNSAGKNPGGSLIIRAPISGEIISDKIVTGQFLKEDADPIVVIAELSKVWITGEVKEKDIRFINTGSPVSVKVNTYPDSAITGTVYHIDELVDENTRSIKVLIQCDNPGKKLKPGIFVTVNYATDSERSIIIPTTALQQKSGSQYVWLKTGKNQFTKRTVIPGESSEKTAKIISGLKPGELIMSKGGIYMQDAK